MQTKDARPYQSFLLRLWKVRDNHARWQASLERVESGERLGFASLQELCTFLLNIEQKPEVEEQAEQS